MISVSNVSMFAFAICLSLELVGLIVDGSPAESTARLSPGDRSLLAVLSVLDYARSESRPLTPAARVPSCAPRWQGGPSLLVRSESRSQPR